MNEPTRWLAALRLSRQVSGETHWTCMARVADVISALLEGWLGASNGTEREPDGYDGIGHRGPWERLVTEQWALAQVMPEEWLRRVAWGEATFLQLRQRQERAAERITVVLDTGPEQLGIPRIGHLAAMLVLADMAGRRGSRLRWGVLCRPDGEMSEGFGRDGYEKLLGARTTQFGSDEMVRAWKELVGQERGGRTVWIGGPGLHEMVGADQPCLTFEEEVHGGELVLRVTLHGAGKDRVRHAPVAEEDVLARLLHAPFLQRARGTRQRRHLSRLPTALFLASPRRAVVLEAPAVARVEHVPRYPWEMQGKARSIRVTEGQHIVAAVPVRKNIFALAVEADGTIWVHSRIPKHAWVVTSIDSGRPAFPQAGHLLPLYRLSTERRDLTVLVLVDREGQAWQFRGRHDTQGGIESWEARRLNVRGRIWDAWVMESFVGFLVEETNESQEGGTEFRTLYGKVERKEDATAGDGKIVLKTASRYELGNEKDEEVERARFTRDGIVAVCVEPGGSKAIIPERVRERNAEEPKRSLRLPERIAVEPGDTVLGVAQLGLGTRRPRKPASIPVLGRSLTTPFPPRGHALIVLDEAKRRVWWIGEDLQRHLAFELPWPVGVAGMHTHEGQVVMVGQGGQWAAFDLGAWRFLPGSEI